MIAQDTGSAIVGPARADIYFGAGDEAGAIAGRIRQQGRFVMLMPRELDLVEAGRAMPLPRPKPEIRAEADKTPATSKADAKAKSKAEGEAEAAQARSQGKAGPPAARSEAASPSRRPRV